MPSPGLSLVGFMDEPSAILHLRKQCVPPPNATDANLKALWQAAQGRLGAPTPNFGNPAIQDFPQAQAQYVEALLKLPWVVNAFGATVTPASIKMIEIDPLLAFQYTVDLSRCTHHCGHLTGPPSIDQLFSTCLPTAQPSENFDFQVQGQSALLKSRSLNFRIQMQGIIQNQAAGILFGAALPLVQVVRYNGQCYLHNGFHRAVGMRRAGATHIPCVLRDVATAQAAGIRNDGGTFPEALMTSANPPTVGHMADGRATSVQLRAFARILHVSWSDYVWPEE